MVLANLFNSLPEAAQILFRPGPLLAIPAGATIGLMFGLVPGLNGSVALSLVLAVTVYIDPLIALVLMVSIYASDQYGGAITGILLNIPGTGGATATAVEGYALTQQGRAGEAVALGRSAAVVGGVSGALVLLVAAPLVARVALAFGPAEFFALGVMGIVVVAAVSGSALDKGLTAGVFGFMLATVGQSAASIHPRFTFGVQDLFGGLHLVWVVIGLYAFSQAFQLASGASKPTHYSGTVAVDWRASWRKIWILRRPVSIGTGTGMIVGAIPGAGATIAAWLSYNLAHRSSKEPEKFGAGSLEGLVAPEAATDSVAGGTMIPTMALGIPGSAGAAIILGGFVLVGLRPGPQFFEEQPAFALSVMLAFLISNLILFVLVMVAMPYFVRVLRIPVGYWPPAIIVLGTVGAFVVQERMVGAYVAIALGLIAYLMVRFDYPLAPALLGVVLGPILESNFQRLVIVTDGDVLSLLLTRPIAVALLALSAYSAIWDVRNRVRNRSARTVSTS